MAQKTLLDVVNNLLLRAREDRVQSTIDNSYATLVAEFVSEAHEEVLDEWDWSAMDKELIVSVPADTLSLNFTTATIHNTDGFRPTDESHLMRRQGSPAATVSRYDYTDPEYVLNGMSPLKEMDWQHFQVWKSSLIDTGNAVHPSVFAINYGPNGTVKMDVWPRAKNDSTFVMQWQDRPTRFEVDGTEDDRKLEIPFRPVQELAMMYLLNERGEEMGEPGNLAERRYGRALAAAKEKDIKSREHSDGFDWSRG